MLGSISFGGATRRHIRFRFGLRLAFGFCFGFEFGSDLCRGLIVEDDLSRVATTMNDGIDRVEALEQRVKEHEITLWGCIVSLFLITAILWLLKRRLLP